MRLPRWVRISGFVVYAVAVAVATHWPKLQIDSPYVERPDLIIHIVVFGAWAMALLISGLVKANSPRRGAVIVWFIAAAYAGIDELTQELPGIYRTAGWDDWAANVTGITLACVVWLVGVRIWLRRERVRAGSSS